MATTRTSDESPRDWHPGDAEFAGALQQIAEQAGTVGPTLAEGDFVSGITAGRRWSGRIEWIEGDRLTIDVGGGWLAVPAKDVTF